MRDGYLLPVIVAKASCEPKELVSRVVFSCNSLYFIVLSDYSFTLLGVV